MSWSKDKLRALASERGETGHDALGRLLLAHERLRGRTEEDYPRDKAGKELDALLERQVTPLPLETAREYPGLKQLRAYTVDRGLSQPSRPIHADKEKPGPIQMPSRIVAAVNGYVRKDEEREPG